MSALLDRVVALDVRAVRALPRLRRPWLTPVMRGVSASGTGPVWLGSTAVLIVLLRLGFSGVPDLAGVLRAMLGAFFSLLAGQAIKAVVRRERPFASLDDHTVLGRRPRDRSMPSTHASTAVGLAVGLTALGHPLAPWVWPWSAAVVASRYYLGVHYPTDLVAGALLGAAFGLVDWRPVVHAVVFVGG